MSEHVKLRVWAPDLTTDLGVLDQPYGIQWVDSLLDLGGGEFTIPHDSPAVQANPDLLGEGNVVVVELDGVPVFAWEVERRRRDRGDTWDAVAVTGPGALGLLRHAAVYPPPSQFVLPHRQRIFGWMSIDYDDAEWTEGAPYSGGRQNNPVNDGRRGQPEGWPDGMAEWIWTRDVDENDSHPTGTVYFRRVLDVDSIEDAAGPARLFVTADDEFVCYFDGVRVAEGADWRGYASVDVELVDGAEHVIAVECYNRPGQNLNPGALLLTVMEVRPDEEYDLGGVYFRTYTEDVFGGPGSGPGWRVLDYPEEPPGVTLGFVLANLFDEAKDRGALPGMDRDFDDVHDSGGVEWAETTEVVVQVGNDNLHTVGERIREWPAELHLHPGTFTLQAFQGIGLDRGLTPGDGLDTVTVPVDRAGELGYESEDERFDVLLVQTEFTWSEVPDDPPSSNGRMEGFLSLAQSPTLAHALKQAAKVRERWAEAATQVTFVTAGAHVPRPYVDYDVGDVIVAPTLERISDAEWSLEDSRVDTIAASMDQAGNIEWVHESAVMHAGSAVRRLITTRGALGDGTLGGKTMAATSPEGGGGREVAHATRTPRIIVVSSTPPSGATENLLWVDTSSIS